MADTRERLVEILEGAGKMIQFPGTLANILIENGVTVGDKWIPTAERLPEEDVRVLVWVGKNNFNFPMIDTDRIHDGRWVRWNGYITHWMPLPEPPKEVE